MEIHFYISLYSQLAEESEQSGGGASAPPLKVLSTKQGIPLDATTPALPETIERVVAFPGSTEPRSPVSPLSPSGLSPSPPHLSAKSRHLSGPALPGNTCFRNGDIATLLELTAAKSGNIVAVSRGMILELSSVYTPKYIG